MKNADSTSSVYSQDSDRGPLWVPYAAAPPQTTWAHAVRKLRHHAFTAVCAACAVGLVAIFALTSLGGEVPSAEALPASKPAADRAAPPDSSARSGDRNEGRLSQRGMLMVRSRPEGAVVWLDGDSLGTTPLVHHGVALGPHALAVRKGGYEPQDTTVVVRQAPAARLALALQRQAATPRPADAPAPRVAVRFRKAPVAGNPGLPERRPVARANAARTTESAAEREARLKRYIREAESEQAERRQRLQRYIREAEQGSAKQQDLSRAAHERAPSGAWRER